MGAPVVHWEFWSKDAAATADFYAKVFDWKITHHPEMNYRMAETGGQGIGGGIMTPEQPGPWPGNMTLYLAVDDLDAYATKITGAGGKMIVEKQEVPGMGSFSLFADPEGRVLGIWKNAT